MSGGAGSVAAGSGEGTAGWPVRCSVAEERPAAALCSVCLQPFSAPFLTVRVDGRAICRRCARREPVPPLANAIASDADPVLASGWRVAVVRLFLQPAVALTLPWSGRLLPALRFGYASTVFGYAAWLAWVYVLQFDLLIQELSTHTGIAAGDSMLVVAPWLAIPFQSALRMGVGATLLHAGARLSGAPADTFRLHARLFALSSCSLLLCVIPALGSFLALLVWLAITLTWLRSMWSLPMWRAFVALLPALLALTALGPAG